MFRVKWIILQISCCCIVINPNHMILGCVFVSFFYLWSLSEHERSTVSAAHAALWRSSSSSSHNSNKYRRNLNSRCRTTSQTDAVLCVTIYEYELPHRDLIEWINIENTRIVEHKPCECVCCEKLSCGPDHNEKCKRLRQRQRTKQKTTSEVWVSQLA